MKNLLVFTLFVAIILFQSCSGKKKAMIPKKITTPSDIPFAYFQDREPDADPTKHVVDIQPEEENKALTDQENTSTVPTKTTTPGDLKVKYFQNRAPGTNQTLNETQLQPEKESKNLITQNETPAIHPKTTTQDDTNVKYIQKLEPQKSQEKEVAQLQAEKESKNLTGPDQIPPSQINKTPEKSTQQQSAKKPETQIYRIVSGSFKIKSNAERFVVTLKNMGYPLTFIEKSDNGFHRVIVQKIMNETEARQYLSAYRISHPKYARAWLLYDYANVINELAFAE